jgi:hypothetical protein
MFDNPKKEFKFYLATYAVFLLCIFIVIFFTSCSNSILLGSQVKPDSTHYSTIFNEITDQDSLVHWYTNIYEGNNWCYYHHQYEEVKNARR